MLDNARQCRDKISAAADKKSLVFSLPFPTAYCTSCMDTQNSPGYFFLSKETNKDCKRGGGGEVMQPSLIYGHGILYKAKLGFNFPPDLAAAEGSESGGESMSAEQQPGVRAGARPLSWAGCSFVCCWHRYESKLLLISWEFHIPSRSDAFTFLSLF